MYITCLSKLIFCWWKHHVFVDAIFWLGKKTPTFGSSWEPGIAAHGGNATACGGAVHCHLASGFLMAVSSVWFFDQLRSIRYLDQKKNWSFGVDNSIYYKKNACRMPIYWKMFKVSSPKSQAWSISSSGLSSSQRRICFFWGGESFSPHWGGGCCAVDSWLIREQGYQSINGSCTIYRRQDLLICRILSFPWPCSFTLKNQQAENIG